MINSPSLLFLGLLPAAAECHKSPVPQVLSWPNVNVGLSIAPELSWKALKDKSHPKAGAYLPDFGQQQPEEVARTINLVWNESKYLEHRQGMKADEVIKHLSAAVDRVVAQLSYKPSVAHLHVLKATACDTFLIMNLTYGGPETFYANAPRVLHANYLKDDRIGQGPIFINACMSLPKMVGVCGHIADYTHELYTLMGLNYRGWTGVTRSITSSGDLVFDPAKPGNHAWSGLVVPNRASGSLTPQQLKIVLNRASITGDHRVALLFSDNTWGVIPEDQRERVRKSRVFPRPTCSMVGAKGDDQFRLMFWMERISNNFENPIQITGNQELLKQTSKFSQFGIAKAATREFEKGLERQ